MKTYLGKRDERGTPHVFVIDAGSEHLIEPLKHVKVHSESFEWGYAGSGPADLALSILADYLEERPTAEQLAWGECLCSRLYQKFKWEFVAQTHRDGFEISETEIAAWMVLLNFHASQPT